MEADGKEEKMEGGEKQVDTSWFKLYCRESGNTRIFFFSFFLKFFYAVQWNRKQFCSVYSIL